MSKALRTCLVGKSPISVEPHFEKFPASHFTQISRITPAVHPTEGRIAIVTDAGLDAMDAAVLLTNGTHADSKAVWS